MERRRDGENEGRRKRVIRRHTDLEVYQRAFALAVRVFKITQDFPRDERFSLIDQIRRSSRSVCSNIAEAWRKRRYPAAFVSKLSDSEGEGAETQVWVQFSLEFGYITRETAEELDAEYDAVLGMLVNMQGHPKQWTF